MNRSTYIDGQVGNDNTGSHNAHYAALVARDSRFDGRFYVGVTSTGVYCRPVCRVRTPKAANCLFFANPAAAEAAGFRPCLRCRPELAPGQAGIDSASRLAWAAAQRIEAGQLDDQGIEGLAARLGITDRHLRRIFADTFGVTTVAYAQTQRLLMAKRLLADTALPITEVALAAGFGSLRRFNTLFQSHYGLTPSDLRRASGAPVSVEGLRFELAFRPPFDWPRLLGFLAGRCVAGVEEVEDSIYRRSVRIEQGGIVHLGWLSLTLADGRNAVAATVSPSLVRVLPAVLAGVRRLCDLACEPDAVARVLGPLAADAPGLRVPGAFDGFEMSVRAVLGQQVTVKAAHTIAGRFVAAFGDEVATPFAGIRRVFPAPQRIAQASVEEIASLGIVRQRTHAILALANEIASGRLDLGPAADVAATLAKLEALPGIGRWTAQYIALRALGWPDAWPSGDVALIKSLGVARAREADAAAEAWRPWRGYATLHLWRRLSEPAPTERENP
ncbi:AlkA N-terminal domain-containing protein [Niveibacterium sp. COAC-50]|uniref:AlkA N-terminal domain-containing protein n=1 Tax=Niveibacterium sp. COAC-50 TaxID=2729384 RepID=UPI001552402E|nr:AlkA N-terminal domain-containing protein [Niveibacterium sp. COAC-50]